MHLVVYDTVNVMVDAMVRANSSDPAKYLSALDEIKTTFGRFLSN